MRPLVDRRAAGMALGGLTLGLLLASCATSRGPEAVGAARQTTSAWNGRLSLQIDGEPAQSFAASFDLRGTPERGSLTLSSPIGSTLAELTWSPDEAVLKNGSETRRYESVDAVVLAATGAVIPLQALFGWLDGRDERVAGWQPDLRQISSGKLRAVRELPLPRADLRIAFDQP